MQSSLEADCADPWGAADCEGIGQPTVQEVIALNNSNHRTKQLPMGKAVQWRLWKVCCPTYFRPQHLAFLLKVIRPLELNIQAQTCQCWQFAMQQQQFPDNAVCLKPQGMQTNFSCSLVSNFSDKHAKVSLLMGSGSMLQISAA